MNTSLLIAEDSYCSESMLNNRYTKPEITHRYAELMKAHIELTEKFKALESKYDKVYDNLKIFAGDRTVQTFIER